MNQRARFQHWLFAGSLVVALLLQLLPLPQPLLPFKPYWLALVLVYWIIEAPERHGLGFAFLLGVAADVVSGELLGEQALRLVVLSFIVLRFRARLRFFPVWQQSLAVLALLLNDRVVMLMVRGFGGAPMPSASFWIAPLVGMLAWPFLFLLLDDLRARLRAGE
ncbi:MAG: rod shape-determining protein MreD [Rhodanobacteraceae bacterium]|jgi:rod shape-determining protein MreD|nr:rod shape-determining protein MreD [Rhodanobacteraceae bacterium]